MENEEFELGDIKSNCGVYGSDEEKWESDERIEFHLFMSLLIKNKK